MADYDLIIRHARNHPYIGITDGKFAGFCDGSAKVELDAEGLLALPGVIDAHVHFNEPGRTEWEGFASGSRACSAGGTTTIFDMPLNAHPPTVDAESFDAKLAAASSHSIVDFAFWGGLVPGNLDDLEPLRDRGVIGLKAFMSQSGVDDFPMADLKTLRLGMERAAKLGLIVAVHAEWERPITVRGTSIRDYLDSRPVAIELDAIKIALDLAAQAGCALHIVHVSSAAGVALVTEARAKGQDVTCETCPHYLILTEEDMLRLGAVAKCAPPLRPDLERRALVDRVRSGEIQTLGSDHSPSPMSMKADADFFKVWGGISGCQHLLPLLFEIDLDPAEIAAMTSSQVSDRFRITGRKGRLAEGQDADLVLVRPDSLSEITASELQYRHQHSPYVGRTVRSRVTRTILRGETIFEDGNHRPKRMGRLIKPNL